MAGGLLGEFFFVSYLVVDVRVVLLLVGLDLLRHVRIAVVGVARGVGLERLDEGVVVAAIAVVAGVRRLFEIVGRHLGRLRCVELRCSAVQR